MSRHDDFNRYLQVAQVNSSRDPAYDRMMRSLHGETLSTGTARIILRVPRAHADFRAVEDSVRAAFGDLRSSRTPDARFENNEIEVKYRPNGFNEVPSDSKGIKDVTNVWYILVSGPIVINRESPYDAYLIRSDEYRAAVDSFKRSSEKFDEADLPSINPDSPNALADIRSAIDAISDDLARAIISKSKKGGSADGKTKGPRMSLIQRVGANRVRFDIKFESLLLLRKLIAESLKN